MENETILALKKEYDKTLAELSDPDIKQEDSEKKMKRLNALGEQYQLMVRMESESAARKEDMELKRKQTNDGKFEKWANIGISVVALIGQLALSSYWMGKGLKFEETGAFTSKTTNWISGITKMFKK